MELFKNLPVYNLDHPDSDKERKGEGADDHEKRDKPDERYFLNVLLLMHNSASAPTLILTLMNMPPNHPCNTRLVCTLHPRCNFCFYPNNIISINT